MIFIGAYSSLIINIIYGQYCSLCFSPIELEVEMNFSHTILYSFDGELPRDAID